jgi:predicted hydrocarbon binding protein
MVTADECTKEVKLMARRAALLHYYFSEAVIEELGEEAGKKLIKKAIWAYGEHCGRAVREGVEALGLPLTDENFGKVRDLPRFGWETGMITLPDGEPRLVATFCPLAATFKELGPRGMELGRLYCFVDQAKYNAYNPEVDFIHARNVLDGDDCCEFVVQPKLKEE